MVRIIPMASSSLHLVSLRPSQSSIRFSAVSSSRVSLSSQIPSRRIAFFHLGSGKTVENVMKFRISRFLQYCSLIFSFQSECRCCSHTRSFILCLNNLEMVSSLQCLFFSSVVEIQSCAFFNLDC